MTSSGPILIQAMVSPAEQPAIRQAAEMLSAALSKAAGAAYRIDCAFPAAFDQLHRSGKTAIVITSLLGNATAIDERWQATEDRLRSEYRALCEDGRLLVFICTVLRHVAADSSPEQVMARRKRIGKLNLLAAELSRETGLFVIDIDRSLADIGALPLQTDYRLAGPYAAGAVAKSIATTLLSAGLDAFVTVELQEAARDLIAAYEPPRAAAAMPKMRMPGAGGVTERSGRLKQTVVPVRHLVDDSQVDLQIRRLMSGRIGIRGGAAMFVRSIRQHGMRSAAMRVFGGIARYLRHRARISAASRR